jgi:hypothetical protein
MNDVSHAVSLHDLILAALAKADAENNSLIAAMLSECVDTVDQQSRRGSALTRRKPNA